jgi:hypothetical protein
MIKIIQFFSLLKVALLEYFSTIFHSWKKNKYVEDGEERLSHGSHKQNNENCENMEGDVDKLTTLLDKSEVHTILFDLPFLFLKKFFAPNILVLEVNIVSKEVVEIIHISSVIFLSEVVLS